jgi:hypothetical protein
MRINSRCYTANTPLKPFSSMLKDIMDANEEVSVETQILAISLPTTELVEKVGAKDQRKTLSCCSEKTKSFVWCREFLEPTISTFLEQGELQS